MSRPVLLALYGMLVVIWSSTWVAIKIGLEDCPALLGAGIRFVLAGVILLALAGVRRQSLRTDARLAVVLALLPFAFAYGLVYWGEQYIPSGLAAVLFGILPLYTALLGSVLLPDQPLRARLVVGILLAIGGLALAFAESADAGDQELALLGAAALALAPLGASLGNISLKLRAGELDAVVLNGWGMLGGGLALLAASALGEDWGELAFTAEAIGSIAYLALIGSAIPFVVLTVLLRHLSAQAISFLAMLLPFGALAFGATLYGEDVTVARARRGGPGVGRAADRRDLAPGRHSRALRRSGALRVGPANSGGRLGVLPRCSRGPWSGRSHYEPANRYLDRPRPLDVRGDFARRRFLLRRAAECAGGPHSWRLPAAARLADPASPPVALPLNRYTRPRRLSISALSF